jgi:hypothetical protein
MYISAYGAVSLKQTGKTLALGYEFESNGIRFTDMVQADYKAILGDSGAAVVYTNPMYITSPFVVGLQSASGFDENGNFVFLVLLTLGECNNLNIIFNMVIASCIFWERMRTSI